MTTTYAILGAGMQGTAAAYDLAKFAEPSELWLADYDLSQAQRSADRVNRLVGRTIARPVQVDALNPNGLRAFLEPVDVLCSCVPYWMHPKVAPVAIQTKTNMCDLGGNTAISLQTLAMDEEAKAAGVTLIPDTGLAPGLVNSVGLALIEGLDATKSVKLYCGVLPQNPKPPFNYKLTFNIEGLLTEYDYRAIVLRNGDIVEVETLAELEDLEIEGLGKMEAFTTSGGTSTAPYSLQGKIQNYEYKTIRFPGHCERMRIFKDFGFWGEEPVEVKGCMVRPREVFYKVFGPKLAAIQDLDQCLVRGVAVGTRNGKRVRSQIDIHDRQCEQTGFTAMERTTGFSIAIHAAAIARGEIRKGAVRYEQALTGSAFLDQIRRRGIHLRTSEEPIDH